MINLYIYTSNLKENAKHVVVERTNGSFEKKKKQHYEIYVTEQGSPASSQVAC